MNTLNLMLRREENKERFPELNITLVRNLFREPLDNGDPEDYIIVNLGPIPLKSVKKAMSELKLITKDKKWRNSVTPREIPEALNCALPTGTKLTREHTGKNFRTYRANYSEIGNLAVAELDLKDYMNFAYPYKGKSSPEHMRSHWGLIHSFDGANLRLRENHGVRSYSLDKIEMIGKRDLWQVEIPSRDTPVRPSSALVFSRGTGRKRESLNMELTIMNTSSIPEKSLDDYQYLMTHKGDYRFT